MSYSSISSLLKKGISRPTLYELTIPNMDREVNDQLELLCNRATIPTTNTVGFAVTGHDAMGVVREQPFMIEYGKPFEIGVISDRNYTVYKAMKEWITSITANKAGNPYATRGGRTNNQRIEYYSGPTGYVRDMTLKKLEQTKGGEYYVPYSVIFNNAYPVSLGELILSSEAYDSYAEFRVQFSYETYTFEYRNSGPESTSAP